VRSSKGTTSVLGTTFNILSRDNNYQVTCLTGRVKVRDDSGKSNVILNPGDKSVLNSQGFLSVETGIDTKTEISWIINKFSFTAEPLKNVFNEIARQYGINIKLPEDLEKSYTGTFIKGDSITSTLRMVCKPFDLQFIQKSENEYVIVSITREGNN
jgi:transmembrane sensor